MKYLLIAQIVFGFTIATLILIFGILDRKDLVLATVFSGIIGVAFIELTQKLLKRLK